MSYHVDFIAHTKDQAREYLETLVYVPPPIKTKLIHMIHQVGVPGPIHVKATGHLANGKESDQQSWGEFRVAPLSVLLLPPPSDKQTAEPAYSDAG